MLPIIKEEQVENISKLMMQKTIKVQIEEVKFIEAAMKPMLYIDKSLKIKTKFSNGRSKISRIATCLLKITIITMGASGLAAQ